MSRSGGWALAMFLACGLGLLPGARAAASEPEADSEAFESPERPPAASVAPVIERDPFWFSSCAVGARCWFSWGTAERNYGGPSPLATYADPLSELTWRNLVSEILEVSASARLFRKLIVSVEGGVGAISSGNSPVRQCGAGRRVRSASAP